NRQLSNRFDGKRNSGTHHAAFAARTKGLAEGVGFEPTLRFPVNTLSKRAPSATRPPLRLLVVHAAAGNLFQGARTMARYNRLIMFLLATLLWINPAMALADTVLLYTAGSLRDALTDVAKAYQAKTGNKIEAKYGPSGILKDEIANGAAADAITVAAGRVEQLRGRRYFVGTTSE